MLTDAMKGWAIGFGFAFLLTLWSIDRHLKIIAESLVTVEQQSIDPVTMSAGLRDRPITNSFVNARQPKQEE